MPEPTEFEKVKCPTCWAETYVKAGDTQARAEAMESHYASSRGCRP